MRGRGVGEFRLRPFRRSSAPFQTKLRPFSSLSARVDHHVVDLLHVHLHVVLQYSYIILGYEKEGGLNAGRAPDSNETLELTTTG